MSSEGRLGAGLRALRVPAGQGALAFAVAVGVGIAAFALGAAGANPGGALALLVSPVFLLAVGLELLIWGAVAPRRAPLADRLLLGPPGGLVVVAGLARLGGATGRYAELAGCAFLVAWFSFLLQYVYRRKQLGAATLRYATATGVLVTVGTAAWFLWALDGVAAPLALTAVLAPFVLAYGVHALRSPAGERIPWLLRPTWAVGLLLFTFLAEFFVGALLDLVIGGPAFLQYIPFLPVAGSAVAQLGVVVYDGLWFGAAILASAWFLVALGATMGALVVLRMREVHVAAQRYRMALTVAVFALAAIYVPSLASSTPLVSSRTLASLPVVGWGFGLRAGGPFESGIFLAVLVMYASVGVLTVLFGRKALCAVMCGAAIMYQGTTTHEMRQFNQTSRVGRYYLGSRLSTAYVAASALALVSLFAISLLAALHRLPTVQVASGQYDTAALPLPVELYFGGLWFVMFVATPYLGTYNCATTGICHWGSLSVPFAKVSLFRLKVKDRKVCQACTTFDCAKACPVGLVDMPRYFRETGEYRSTKCCGVGDCVGACPYGNLYHQDVRFWLGRSVARLTRRSRGTPLPMVPTATPSGAPAAEAASRRSG